MDNQELFQMFFSVTQKTKFNLMKMGIIADPCLVIELIKIFDEMTIELYKIAAIEGIELKYHMDQMDRYSDNTYALNSITDYSKFKKEAYNEIEHILKYLKEEIEIYGKEGKAPVVSKLINLSEKFYDAKLKLIGVKNEN